MGSALTSASSAPASASWPRHVCATVCGWRAAWNTSAIRLKHRVDDLASKLRPRARVIFMNSHARDEVARALAACGYPRRPADDGARATTEAEYVTSAGVVIVHVVGDATSPRDLEPLVVGAPARATGRSMRFALCVRARAWVGVGACMCGGVGGGVGV